MNKIRTYPHDYCLYGMHEMKPNEGYILWDDHLNLERAPICKKCYAEYIFRYYPGGRMAQYICENISDYGMTELPTIPMPGEIGQMVLFR